MSKNLAELNQGPGSYRVGLPQIVCARTSPIIRPVYHTCSIRLRPVRSYVRSTQSPTAYMSGTFVFKNSSTRMPRLVFISDPFKKSMLGETPTANPTNSQAIDSPLLVNIDLTLPFPSL